MELLVGAAAFGPPTAAGATAVGTTGLFGASGAFGAAQTLSTLSTLATGASLIGGMNAAAGAEAEADFQARQLKQNAGQERASAQRAAQEERRRKRLAQSRAVAVAGASGGGVHDPTVLDAIGDIEQEGEYRALTAMYQGEERARGNINSSRAASLSGRSRATGMRTKTIMGSGMSLLEKYG